MDLFRRITMTACGVIAASGLALAVPAAAAAAPTQPSAAPAASGVDIHYKYYSGGGKYYEGEGHFIAKGEHLYACDENTNNGNNRSVTSRLYWAGKVRATVTDTVPLHGCAEKNLTIAEGTPVSLSVCVEGLPCSPFVSGRA